MREATLLLLVSCWCLLAPVPAQGQRPVYGNYGMPHHTGGGIPTGDFPTDFSKPAVDSLDELFKAHDQAYWAAELHGGDRVREFRCQGDRILVRALRRLVLIPAVDWAKRPRDPGEAGALAGLALVAFEVKVLALCS